ncbi:MAG: hypothetical protein ACOCSR_04340 [Wenzhouxiangella sp.]
MKMIGKFESRAEAEERAAFLRSRGIATHVSDMTSMRMNLAHQGRFRAGLWVVFEEHYEDAAALLTDPEHRVERPLSERELEHIEAEGAGELRKTLIKWLLVIAAGLLVLAGLVAGLGK